MDVMIRTITLVDATEDGVDFEDFFRSEYPDLAKALLLLTRDPVEAEDIVWVATSKGEVWRIDPRTNQLTGRPIHPSGYTVGDRRGSRIGVGRD